MGGEAAQVLGFQECSREMQGPQEAAKVLPGQRFPREVDNGFGRAEVNIFIVKIYRFSECIRTNYNQPIEPD